MPKEADLVAEERRKGGTSICESKEEKWGGKERRAHRDAGRSSPVRWLLFLFTGRT